MTEKYIPFLIRIGVLGRLRLKVKMAALRAKFMQEITQQRNVGKRNG